MFKLLSKWLTKPSYQSDLDAFITSKQPTTVAEVEHWVRYYDQHISRGFVA